jgi:SAM-dependent methyltransferase
LLDAQPGERILDIGCGPAYLLDDLPAVHYVGFDTDARYLAYARERYGHRGEFILSEYNETQRERHAPFDGILLMGLIHHLDDSQASDLLQLLAQSLTPNGRAITLDPCFTPDQSRIARFMARNDRGQFVRDELGYVSLVKRCFADVSQRVMHGICRVPSTEIVMVLRSPLAVTAEPRRMSRASS